MSIDPLYRYALSPEQKQEVIEAWESLSHAGLGCDLDWLAGLIESEVNRISFETNSFLTCPECKKHE